MNLFHVELEDGHLCLRKLDMEITVLTDTTLKQRSGWHLQPTPEVITPNKNYLQTQILHCSSFEDHNTPNINHSNSDFLFFFFSVDDLLKEAKVGPNGTIKYEEFVRVICLPAVDY